ncbi:MAG: spore maturation protein [Clostridia bacterium]|nr:spore maturation protein [Clostridia bacterium]
MRTAGAYAIPAVMVMIVVFAVFKKVSVFEAFTKGAKSGAVTAFEILPSLVGLVVAVSMLKESGALELLVKALSPVATFFGIEKSVIPLALLNPISGGGSLSMYESLLKSVGPDSYAGRVASVMMGSTETTFYAVTVYYGSVGIRRTRQTIPAAVCADITSYIVSSHIVKLFFGV